jgi:hypothetical protein
VDPQARFKIGGYQFPEIDLAPVFGVLLIAIVTYFLAIDPAWR